MTPATLLSAFPTVIRGSGLRSLARRALWVAGAATLMGCASLGGGAAPEVRQALAPSGVLRIGVYPGSPTSLVRGPAPNEMRGLTVEVGRALAGRLGVPFDIVVFERVPQIVDGLKSGQVDMTITNASPARAKEIDFTPPVVLLETGYLVPANSRLQTLAQVDAAGVRIGVSQGSTSQGTLTQQLKAATVVPAPSVVAAAEMMRKGQLDAFATNKGILFEMADRVPGSRVLDGRWGLEQLAIGVPKGREAGAAFLKAFAADASTQALVKEAAARAGLRGLATAESR